MHSPSSLLLACASFPANALCCLLCCLSSHEECRNKWRPCYARLLPTTGATTGDFPLSSSPPVPRLVFLFPDQFPACRRLLGPFRLGSLLFFLAAFVRLLALCCVCLCRIHFICALLRPKSWWIIAPLIPRSVSFLTPFLCVQDCRSPPPTPTDFLPSCRSIGLARWLPCLCHRHHPEHKCSSAIPFRSYKSTTSTNKAPTLICCCPAAAAAAA